MILIRFSLLIFAGYIALAMTACGAKSDAAQYGQPAANSNLTLVTASPMPNSSAAKPTLEGMYWTLTLAADGQNRPIDIPTSSNDRPVVFTFTNGIVNIQGPCNQLAGSYTGGNATPLVIGPMRSTMKGCDPEVMTAESKLSAMLSGPLQVTLESGSAPKLRLVNSANETLSFEGKPTPESLYGPAKIIFMEVGPKRIPCSNPNGETTCLEVRDRFFDEKGLQSAAPGTWRPLFEKIEGYSHVEGQRNVIRVKSFTPPNSKSNIYVLDLVVETETVK